MIQLGDFGLAVQLDNSKSVRSTFCGTSGYMAPEVYNGAAEAKSDVWALGISLIELAEGKNPFAGLKSSAVIMNKVLTGPPPSLSPSKWSERFVDFVGKCLMKEAKERWSVTELMNVRYFCEE